MLYSSIVMYFNLYKYFRLQSIVFYNSTAIDLITRYIFLFTDMHTLLVFFILFCTG